MLLTRSLSHSAPASARRALVALRLLRALSACAPAPHRAPSLSSPRARLSLRASFLSRPSLRLLRHVSSFSF